MGFSRKQQQIANMSLAIFTGQNTSLKNQYLNLISQISNVKKEDITLVNLSDVISRLSPIQIANLVQKVTDLKHDFTQSRQDWYNPILNGRRSKQIAEIGIAIEDTLEREVTDIIVSIGSKREIFPNLSNSPKTRISVTFCVDGPSFEKSSALNRAVKTGYNIHRVSNGFAITFFRLPN